MDTILSIDQSTSATKALLYDCTGGVVARASLEHRQIYPRPGWVEHDAEELWRNTLEAAAAVLKHGSAPVCVSLTNQRETFVVFDRRTGRPLHHAIVWQCRRGEGICTELTRAGHDDVVRRKTGLRIDTYFTAPKLAWVMRNETDVAERIRHGDALVGTVDAYLIYRLTGGAVFATDPTNASRTLLYDINTLGWDAGLCDLFGVPLAALPDVRECAAEFGRTDLGGLLAHPVPIRGVMGDSQAALFAQGCYQPGATKVTFGTGSSVLLNVGPTPPTATGGTVAALAWVLDGRPTYCYEGIINYSAATLSWLRDRLGLIRDFAEADPLAEAAKDNGGVYLVPAFAGLGAPHWNASARAAIVGLSPSSGREHLVRAGLESIAYQVRDVLEMMAKDARVRPRVIRADGGATASRFLMQFVADTAGLEVRASDAADCSALGAALAGMLGLGLYPSLDELAALPRPDVSYVPTADPAAVAANCRGWERAVRGVLGIAADQDQNALS